MYVDIDGLNIFYEVEGEGEDVLLLHGWGASTQAFAPVFRQLAERFRVYSLDFPGFGNTPAPDQVWGVEDYADMVVAFIKKMGINKINLIGHSFGGRVSIVLSAKYPQHINKLILVDSAGLIPKRGWRYYFKVYKFKMMKKIYTLVHPGKDLEDFYKKYGSSDYKQTQGVMRKIFVKVVNQDLKGYLAKIKASTLLIWGEKDKDTPVEFGQIMEREIPDSGLVVLEDAGHYSYLDQFGRFMIITFRFLEGE
ncbi:MAG: alpha/beta hydrolase [Clostridia bacterium]|nr:alpha/beta hydrolase [Clostridia bacterium]